MKREELWLIIVKKNPSMAGERVSMSVEQLRRMFDLVWQKGYEAGKDEAGAAMFEGLMGVKL